MKLKSSENTTKNVDIYLEKLRVFFPFLQIWFLILDSFMILCKMMFPTRINIKFWYFDLFYFLNQK